MYHKDPQFCAKPPASQARQAALANSIGAFQTKLNFARKRQRHAAVSKPIPRFHNVFLFYHKQDQLVTFSRFSQITYFMHLPCPRQAFVTFSRFSQITYFMQPLSPVKTDEVWQGAASPPPPKCEPPPRRPLTKKISPKFFPIEIIFNNNNYCILGVIFTPPTPPPPKKNNNNKQNQIKSDFT